ncbi:DUF2631 domain-containing protein [Cryptosporangium sp. NPDC051539]|uniref:DUF2631 domain-containing protein n=1 Tax=Cryptosporangium sp. NPDC051539 TaxID=3363962 RepID=UPI00379F32D6
MAEEEPVIAPDQLREGHPRLWRGLAVVSAISLLLMVVGNHQGHVEDLFLIGGALTILALIVWDGVQRRYGVKR